VRVGGTVIGSHLDKGAEYQLSAKLIEVDNDFAGAAAGG
jgi:hypothetical protein